MFGMSVKSVPGCFVAMAPILIGAPVAFLPVPRPQTLLTFDCFPDPMTCAGDWLAPVAKAASSNAMALLTASASAAVSFFFLIHSSFGPPLSGQLCAVGSPLGPPGGRVRQRLPSILAGPRQMV